MPAISRLLSLLLLAIVSVANIVSVQGNVAAESMTPAHGDRNQQLYLQTIQNIELAMQSVPHDSSALYKAGETLKQIGGLSLAAKEFSSAIASAPFGFRKNYEAASVLQYVIYDNEADDVEALEQSILHYDRALKAMWNDQDNEAVSADLKPTSQDEKVAILVDASRALGKKESTSIAIQLLLKAFEINSQNIQVVVDLYLSYISENDFENAKTFAEHAVRLQPNVVHYHDDLGSIFKLLGDFSAAEKEWKTSVELNDPVSIPSLCNLGHLAQERGDFQTSYLLFSQALEAFNVASSIKGNQSKESVSLFLSRLKDLNYDSSISSTKEELQVSSSSDSNVIFEMELQYFNEEKQQSLGIPINLKAFDDPLVVAQRLMNEFNLDLLTFRWLHQIFLHASRRLSQQIIQTHQVTIDGNEMELFELRCGDDLAMLARSYAYRHNLSAEVGDALLSFLIEKVPQHSDEEWMNCRSILRHIGTRQVQRDFFLENNRDEFTNSRSCSLTVAITTNSRDAFLRTINNFPPTDEVCDVIVVPGSIADIHLTALLKDFPHFNFVMSADRNKGEVHSLNTIMRLAKTRYLLYLNDAWQPTPVAGNAIKQALSILKGSSQPLAQVLLNDQSSHDCQLGMANTECSKNNRSWRRTVLNNDQQVEYVLHEFASLYPEHTASSSFWPGLSLSRPAVWDLNAMSSKMALMIDDVDDYELTFSLRAMDAGLKTAYLPNANSFRYVG